MRNQDFTLSNKTMSLVIVLLTLCTGIEAQAGSTPLETNQIKLHSSVIEEDVTLRISLPAGYDKTSRDYPVIYLLDGELFMNQAVSAMEFLNNTGYSASLVPAHIIVGITTQDRDHSLTPTRDEQFEDLSFPTSGGGPKFLEFLSTELFPYIHEQYRCNDHDTLAGWSLGGLFTTWTYLAHPSTCDKYLAISPSLWWDDGYVIKLAEESVTEQKRNDATLVVTLGSLEKGNMEKSVKMAFVPFMDNQGQSVNYRFIEIDGESHNTSPYISLYRGLRSLHQLATIPEHIINADMETQRAYMLNLASSRGLPTKSTDAACEALIKLAVRQGSYDVGLQVGLMYAEKLSTASKPMLLLGELYFRLDRQEDSVAAFKAAIDRENSMDNPDQESLKYYNEYLNWILEQKNS